jgi:TPR repeat protein
MLLVVIATALAIWLVPGDDRHPVELPSAPVAESPAPVAAQDGPLPTAAAPASGTPGSAARRLIAELRASGNTDPQAAYDEARRQDRAGSAEDAYLLDFYAARLGHGDAALSLGRQADPIHWRAGGALPAAAPEQALRWYREADRAGHSEAKQHLDALHRWAERAASRGNAQAQRLMLAWQ